MKRATQSGKVDLSLLVCGFLLSATACHKKAPAPPPPPPPAAAPPAPPPPAKPAIGNFTAESSHIERGQSSTLTRSVGNATDISIDNNVGAVQGAGSRQVTPGHSKTYTLTAKGPGGTDSRSVTVEVSAPPPPQPAPGPKPTAAQVLSSEVQDAYFDFDQYNIRPDAQQALTRDAGALKQIFADFPGFVVIIEGNCDQRGSAEYNLALGGRRATAAKDFVVQLGAPADRLKTISYGKERLVCTEMTGECYRRNRHVHFSAGQ